MRRVLNLLRVQIFPELCFECRKKVDRAMRELETIRRMQREIGPELRAQKAAAKSLCDELLELPVERQQTKIRRTVHRLRSRPLAEELLRRSWSQLHHDPLESVRLGRLAVDVAFVLRSKPILAGGERGICDLEALAYAYIANGHRVACRWEEATDSFRVAESRLDEGTGDSELLAEILWLKGNYYKDRRDFPRALRVLHESAELYREMDDQHQRGKIFNTIAAVNGEAGSLQSALKAHLAACRFVDRDRNPRLAAMCWQNLAFTYYKLKAYREAEDVLDDTEHFFQRTIDPNSSLLAYRAWMRARVAKGLGDLAKAEEIFWQLKAEFEERRIPFNVALVLLDLAELYVEANRIGDVEAIAEQTLEALISQPLKPEVSQALVLFRKAAKRRKLVVEMVQATARIVERHKDCRPQTQPS